MTGEARDDEGEEYCPRYDDVTEMASRGELCEDELADEREEQYKKDIEAPS